MKLTLAFAVILIILGMSESFSEEIYEQGNRKSYIQESLDALRHTDSKIVVDVHNYISAIERNNCRSSIESLKIECLLSAAKSNCEEKRTESLKKKCDLFSDIIVINKLSGKNFLSRRERYRMMKTSQNYRKTLLKELRRKYAEVATDFSLTNRSDCKSTDTKCLAEGIDQFCLGYADFKDLSWQYCVGALVWFIGTSEKN